MYVLTWKIHLVWVDISIGKDVDEWVYFYIDSSLKKLYLSFNIDFEMALTLEHKTF